MLGKKIRTTKNKRVFFTTGLFVTFIVVLLLFSTSPNFEELQGAYIAESFGIAGVVATILAIIVSETYIQVFDDGFEVTKGGKTTKYAFSDFEGTNVVRNSINGVYTGMTREIKLNKPGQKLVTINANNLNCEKFSTLISYIGRNKIEAVQNVEEYEAYFNTPVSFDINSEQIVKANKTKVTAEIIVMIVCAIVFIVAMILYLVLEVDDKAVILVVAIMSGLAIPVFGMLEYFPDITRYGKMKNLPGRITMDNETLRLGNVVYTPDKIRSISMVPGNYTILDRDMFIMTHDGQVHGYNFGKADADNKYTYNGYPELADAVRLWSLSKHIDFITILG